MAACNLTSFSGLATVNWGGVSMDGTKVIGWNGFDIYSMNAATWSGESIIISRAGLVWNCAVDASDQIWWTELNFGTGKNELYKATLAGTGVTLIDADVQCSSQIAYDMVGDRFWYVQFGNGIWTMTKTGVENQRYANAGSVNWTKPVIANDGAAWLVYNTPLMVRVSATFTAQTRSTGFTTSQPMWPGCDDDVLTKNAGVVTHYAAGITATADACTFAGSGGGWAIWNGDMTRVYYVLVTSGGFNSYGFECVFEEGGIPPLRVYMRDDRLDVSGARADQQGATSWQQSIRVRQGASYL